MKTEIINKVKHITRTPAFVTLKDHKDNFSLNPTCSLLNPSEKELGKLRKQFLEKINSDITDK